MGKSVPHCCACRLRAIIVSGIRAGICVLVKLVHLLDSWCLESCSSEEIQKKQTKLKINLCRSFDIKDYKCNINEEGVKGRETRWAANPSRTHPPTPTTSTPTSPAFTG
ncbi:hypothetical protein J6590_047557 [Homalodisca vitripennis]|nr:hypothetical protein J6590_047557 [Homalodisca vitripennis]